MSKKTSAKRIFSMNQKMIYQYLYDNEPLSRADLVKELHLSFPAVSSNIRRLLELELIHEKGVGNKNNIGRTSTLLEVDCRYAFSVCGNISIYDSEVGLFDLKGNLIRDKKFRTPQNSLKELVSELDCFYSESIKEYPFCHEKIKVVSLGIHGIKDLDKSKNYLHFSNDLTDIEKEIARIYSGNVIIENDVNMAAIGEWAALGCDPKANTVYINFSEGIGAGIIIGGKLYTSNKSSSGEIGNIVLEKEQMFKDFTIDGAFESLVLGADAKVNIDKMMLEIANYDRTHINQLILRLKENPVFLFICMMLINVSCFINPDKIIIGGTYGSRLALIGDALQRIVDHYTPSVAPAIVAPITGEKAAMKGAVYLSLSFMQEMIQSLLDSN